MSDEDDNVTRFPVRPKAQPPEDRCLVEPHEVPRPGRCWHRRFIVDDALDTVECADCGDRLNPMWVLVRLAREDRAMIEGRRRAREEMAALEKRQRTKCQHCGQMTRIRQR